ncbi:uncharacterized protein EV154DRAFT_553294 [Mucor mucedo]|uniref:uncharacterized protein n=1 Tax=Mucor mucedo TaxID=29922 RepID=UPI00221FF3F0|nr:uncharacterized protein EV154DRAFT_553294 [Mucor mucedo]KAI7889135.1 hypothetical protein EV154DRAFT_553294 [Mucor mucedo]
MASAQGRHSRLCSFPSGSVPKAVVFPNRFTLEESVGVSKSLGNKGFARSRVGSLFVCIASFAYNLTWAAKDGPPPRQLPHLHGMFALKPLPVQVRLLRLSCQDFKERDKTATLVACTDSVSSFGQVWQINDVSNPVMNNKCGEILILTILSLMNHFKFVTIETISQIRHSLNVSQAEKVQQIPKLRSSDITIMKIFG